MITIAHSLPVTSTGQSPLSRAQLWKGLVSKAENPIGFLADMKSSRITERFAGGFTREVVHGADRIHERVQLFEPTQITFERTAEDARGWVTNVISESPEGLTLTFVAHLPDAPNTKREALQTMFAEAVASTLAEIRRLVAAGQL